MERKTEGTTVRGKDGELSIPGQEDSVGAGLVPAQEPGRPSWRLLPAPPLQEPTTGGEDNGGWRRKKNESGAREEEK